MAAIWCGAGDRSLQGLPDDQIAEKLSTAGMHTCRDVLMSNPLELMAASERMYDGIHDILVSVSRKVVPKAKTAYELLEMRKHHCMGFVPSSLLKLDKALQGGLHCGTVTEIAGPPGCGKTQFCMTVCISAIERRLPAMYIDTEGAFTAERLLEMATYRWRDSSPALTLNKYFHIYKDLTYQHLLKRLEGIEESVVADSVKVIVIDSVASVMRREFDTSSAGGARERIALMSKISCILKYLAHTHKIAVLVVNQVTTQVKREDTRCPPSPASDGRQPKGEGEGARSSVGVALGNTWAHCVNTRLVMEFLTSELRKLSIAKSPLAPPISVACRVEARGVVMDWQATSKLEEVKDCDCEGGLTVHADVLAQDGLLWEQ